MDDDEGRYRGDRRVSRRGSSAGTPRSAASAGEAFRTRRRLHRLRTGVQHSGQSPRWPSTPGRSATTITAHELMRYAGIHTLVLPELLRESATGPCWFEIDTYWITHGGGDPAAWIDKVAGRIPCVHFKDMQPRPRAGCRKCARLVRQSQLAADSGSLPQGRQAWSGIWWSATTAIWTRSTACRSA